MRVIVTGGGGFIGRAVVGQLLSKNHHVEVVDHSVGLDVRSAMAANMIASADVVIHLAGMLGTGELFEHPEAAVDININGTLAVLQACARGRGSPTRYVGITMPDVWVNVYQATKRCAMDLAEAWRMHRDVPVLHVRAYNVFGPGQKVGTPQKIVPTFASRSWAGQPIPIWGDGSQTVDLIHVDDVARYLVEAATRGTSYGPGTFEACTGTAIPVGLVAGMVNSITGSTAGVQHLPMRAGETPHTELRAEPTQLRVTSAAVGATWRPRFDWERFEQTVRSYDHEDTQNHR